MTSLKVAKQASKDLQDAPVLLLRCSHSCLQPFMGSDTPKKAKLVQVHVTNVLVIYWDMKFHSTVLGRAVLGLLH